MMKILIGMDGMEMILTKISKGFFLTLVLLVLLFNGACSKPTITVSEGYDFTSFGSGLSVYTELADHTLKLGVKNRDYVFYQIWLLHKYNSKTKKGNSRELVYEGRKNDYNVNIVIPQDDTNTEHNFSVKILNKQGDLLYKTPILNLKSREK